MTEIKGASLFRGAFTFVGKPSQRSPYREASETRTEFGTSSKI
jgi:hypothetical protein